MYSAAPRRTRPEHGLTLRKVGEPCGPAGGRGGRVTAGGGGHPHAGHPAGRAGPPGGDGGRPRRRRRLPVLPMPQEAAGPGRPAARVSRPRNRGRERPWHWPFRDADRAARVGGRAGRRGTGSRAADGAERGRCSRWRVPRVLPGGALRLWCRARRWPRHARELEPARSAPGEARRRRLSTGTPWPPTARALARPPVATRWTPQAVVSSLPPAGGTGSLAGWGAAAGAG